MKITLDCPFCDGIAYLTIEPTRLTFRGKELEIKSAFYKCGECNQEFTTTELDEENIQQVYNQL